MVFASPPPSRCSSLSLGSSLHSICTRENSLERGGGGTIQRLERGGGAIQSLERGGGAIQSCPTSPTKIPLPSDSPLLSKVLVKQNLLHPNFHRCIVINHRCCMQLQGPLDPTLQRVRSFQRELRRARSFRAAREKVDLGGRVMHVDPAPQEHHRDGALQSLCPPGTQVQALVLLL